MDIVASIRTSVDCSGMGLRLAFAILLTFGLQQTGSAASCNVADVTLGGMSAYSCGWANPLDNIANTPVNDPQQANDYMGWDVNLNGDGGSSNWQYFYKQDLGNQPYPGGIATPDYSLDAGSINLQVTSLGGNDNWSTGTFTVNAEDPILIVLSDGANYSYHWYLFTGKTGTQNGIWDATTIFGGMDVSNITAYTQTVPPSEVPVPAAVWLFGSGLLGLVGIARRKKPA